MENGLTIAEYAEKIGKSVPTVYRLLQQDQLDFYTDGSTKMIIGSRQEIGCTWNVIYPGEPARYVETNCGNKKYVFTDDVKSYKYCPYCGLPINMEKIWREYSGKLKEVSQ